MHSYDAYSEKLRKKGKKNHLINWVCPYMTGNVYLLQDKMLKQPLKTLNARINSNQVQTDVEKVDKST